MALDWYRTPDWTEEDERRLPRRLAAQRGYAGRAFVLRVKADLLIRNGDPARLAVAQRLLRQIIEDPELESASTNDATSSEVSSAFNTLGQIADRAGDVKQAEEYFRKGQHYSLTPGTGLALASFLARSADIAKLKEADQLLDEVESAKTPPQLLFTCARRRYAVARARVYARLGLPARAAEFAKAALATAQRGAIDSFKQKPLDDDSLDTATVNEMSVLAGYHKG